MGKRMIGPITERALKQNNGPFGADIELRFGYKGRAQVHALRGCTNLEGEYHLLLSLPSTPTPLVPPLAPRDVSNLSGPDELRPAAVRLPDGQWGEWVHQRDIFVFGADPPPEAER